MADQNRQPQQGAEPPKIRLNGNGKASPPAAPASQQPKKETSRIPLTAPTAVPASKSDTSRISQTAPTTPAAIPPTQSKKDTSRISLTSAVAPPKGGRPATIKTTPDEPKKATARVALPTDQIRPMSETSRIEATKKSTVRVQIEDAAKGDTQQILLQRQKAAASPEGKTRTSQININEILPGEDQDIFKRRTTLLDPSKYGAAAAAPAAPTPIPRTIRIKEGPPTTTFQKPQEAPPAAVVPLAAPEVEVARKSETSRIELPPEAGAAQPPTRRKTIRIKRPEGGTGTKTLIVARPEDADESSEPTITFKPQAELGALWSLVALATLLITAGVITYQILALNNLSGF